MRALLLICSGLLLIGIANLPIGYYTLLRIVVSIGAVAIIVSEYKGKINAWIIIFGLIAILFNPFIPIYFQDKSIWTVIDVIVGILFIIKSFLHNKKQTL